MPVTAVLAHSHTPVCCAECGNKSSFPSQLRSERLVRYDEENINATSSTYKKKKKNREKGEDNPRSNSFRALKVRAYGVPEAI